MPVGVFHRLLHCVHRGLRHVLQVSARDIGAVCAESPSFAAATRSFVDRFWRTSSCRLRLLRRHPSLLIVWRAVADLGCCLVVASSVGYRRLYPASAVSGAHCKTLSFFNEFFSMAAEGYFLFLTIDLKVAITKPFSNFRLASMW